MINTTEHFIDAVSKTSRTFVARFLYDEQEIDCGIRSLKIYKGACGNNSFMPGSVYSSYIDATIDIREYALENKELKLQIGLILEDGNVEYVDIGCYTVMSPKSTVYQTSFTAVGRITAKLNDIFDVPQICDITNIAESITSTTGVPIIFRNINPVGTIEKGMIGLTCKEALEVITSVLGGFATEDAQGNIVISKFPSIGTIEVDGERMTALPEFNDYDYDIYGIKVTVSEAGQDEDGNPIEEVSFLEGNPKIVLSNAYMTERLFAEFSSNIVGYKFRPGKVNLALGDPRIEPWDCMTVEDVKGSVFTVPCLNVMHNFDGGLTTEIIAPGESESESSSVGKGPIVQQLERINATLLTVNSAILKRLKAAEAELLYAKITDLNATKATIEDLKTNSITAEYLATNYATIIDLNTASAAIQKLETAVANVEELIADKATIKSLNALEAKVENLKTTFITAEAADLKYATIETLNAINTTIVNLSANKVDVSMANINEAWITNLLVKGKFLAEEVNAAVGNFSKYLTGVNIVGDNITAGTIKTDRLIIRDSESDTGILFALNNGIVEQTNLTAEELKRLALDGSIIVAESITADKINVTDLFAQDIISTGDFNMGGSGALYYNAETDELSIRAKEISIKSSNVATKEDINNLEIGGRNLLLATRDCNGFEKYNGEFVSGDDGFFYANFEAINAHEYRWIRSIPIKKETILNKDVVFSYEVRSDVPWTTTTGDTTGSIATEFALCNDDSTNRLRYIIKRPIVDITEEWQKIVVKITLTEDVFVGGTASFDDCTRFHVRVYDSSIYPLQIRKFKLEYGNQATDWTPAPEDSLKAVKKFYLLQQSTVDYPSLPVAYPPGEPWSEIEPVHSGDSSTSLYIIDAVEYSDGSYTYSDIYLSSPYEAAKNAYDKALSAENATGKVAENLKGANKDIGDLKIGLENTNANLKNEIERVTTVIESSIKQSANEISLEVAKSYATKDEVATERSRVDILSGQFSVKIKTIEDVESFMEFNEDGNLIIGKSDSEIKSVQDNDSYQFADKSGNVLLEINTKGVNSPTVNVEKQVTYFDKWAVRRGAYVNGVGYNLNDVWIGG